MLGFFAEKEVIFLPGLEGQIPGPDADARRLVEEADAVGLALEGIEGPAGEGALVDGGEAGKIGLCLPPGDDEQIPHGHVAGGEHLVGEGPGLHKADAFRQVLFQSFRQGLPIESRQIRVQGHLPGRRGVGDPADDPGPEDQADQGPEDVAVQVFEDPLHGSASSKETMQS